jgi:hypothetical protein
VVGSVTVNVGGSLTIEDGCAVRFDQGALLQVSGSLTAVGTVSGLLFTRRDPLDEWKGIRFNSGSTGILADCVVEYVSNLGAGYGIRVDNSTVDLQNCTVRNSDSGIYAWKAIPSISGCTLEGNTTGLTFDEATAPLLTSTNTFQNNTVGVKFDRCTSVAVDNQIITGSQGIEGALLLKESGAFHLGPGNVITGNSWGLTVDIGSAPDAASLGNIPVAGNTNTGIQIRGGSTSGNVVFRDVGPGPDYRVTLRPVVAPAGTVTIDGGATLWFDPNVGLTVQGILDVAGSVDTVTLAGAMGDWAGVIFDGGDGLLRGCSILGATIFGTASGVHAINGASPAFEGCVIMGNSYGVNVFNATASFVNCTIAANDAYGIYLSGGATVTFGANLSEWNVIRWNGLSAPGRDFYNSTQDIAAPYVYWDSTDEAFIETRIFHEPDDPSRGRVTFAPWTDFAHSVAFGPPFTDVTPPALLAATDAQSAAWGDIDGDGDHDLFVGRAGLNRLFRNDTETFVDVTPVAFTDTSQTQQGAFADCDNDGDLDLFVANFDGASPIYRNDGGSWIKVWGEGHLWSIAWGDLEPDGDLDALGSSTTGSPSKIFRNDGSLPSWSGETIGLNAPRHSTFVDYNRDGNTDVVIAGSDGALSKVEFHQNDGTDFQLATTFSDHTSQRHYSTVAAADADGDGDLDVFAGGYAIQDHLLCSAPGDPEFCTPSALADTGLAISGSWADYDNDGRVDLYLTNEESPNRLYQNQGSNEFVDVAASLLAGASADDGGAAWADYDGDGDLDLFVAGFGSPNRLLRNDSANGNHWLQVDLEGVATNRFGFGSIIEVIAGGTSQIHEVSTGSGRCAQNSITAEFGLGTTATIDAVVVRWRSGGTQVVTSVPIDSRISIVETTGATDAIAVLPSAQLALGQSFPSPFRGSTRIGFGLPEASSVSLRVFDVTGRLVRVLRDGPMDPGRHTVGWDGRDSHGRAVAAGVYFYRFDAEDFRETRRVVRVR